MTAVGKILVFFNLMFAFVVGAFAVLNYISRTHWADQYTKLQGSYEVVKAKAEVEKRENDRLIEDKKNYEAALRGLAKQPDYKEALKDLPDDAAKAKSGESAKLVADKMKQQSEEIERLKKQLEKERDKSAKLDQDVVKFQSAATVALADSTRREENEKKLREVLAAETERTSKLTERVNFMRDRAVAAEIDAKSLKGRNVQLEDKMQEMAKRIVALSASGGRPAATTSPTGRNPPPEQVEGLIQRVDGDLVTMTIGSDAGLQKGHTMFVFGLGGNVGYRGEIKLVEVTPKVAVGQLIKGKQVSRVRVGDTVASDIMPRR